jgi:hypothetical protein
MSSSAAFVDPLLAWKSQHGNEIERVPGEQRSATFSFSSNPVGISLSHRVPVTDIYMGKVGDMPVTPFCERSQFDALKNEFLVREGDVWLVTYLKSGTTLTQEIFKFFLGLGVNDNPLAASPWLEVSARVPMIGLPIAVANTIPSTNGHRFWKSHWLPRDHLAPNGGKSKFVYVARNGLDVVVSFYHHIRGFPLYEYTGDLSDFFDKFMDDGKALDFGSWWEHVAAWWRRRNDADVLFLHYEDLLKEPRANVVKLAQFCGVALTDARVDEIVHETSFAQMKTRPLFYDLVRAPDAAPFLRNGKSGEGKVALSADQVRRFEDKCKAFFVGDLADFPWQRSN